MFSTVLNLILMFKILNYANLDNIVRLWFLFFALRWRHCYHGKLQTVPVSSAHTSALYNNNNNQYFVSILFCCTIVLSWTTARNISLSILSNFFINIIIIIVTRRCSESANLCQGQNLKQNWSEIQIQISRLIQIWIHVTAGSLSKCRGFITCWSQSFHRVSWKSAGDSMRNANKSPKITYSIMARDGIRIQIRIRDRITTNSWSVLPTPSLFQWNQLMTLAVNLHTETEWKKTNDRQTALIAQPHCSCHQSLVYILLRTEVGQPR